MFINKSKDGKNNICGKNISILRKKMNLLQRELAVIMQIAGIDMDKNAIQRIEAGKRFVTDIELKTFSEVLKIDMKELLH